jgi:hypothetical protein
MAELMPGNTANLFCDNPLFNPEGIGSFSPGLARFQRAYPGWPQFSSKTLQGLNINTF